MPARDSTPPAWVIGTIRREYLDQVLFWNALDLTRKLEAFRDYYNASRVHRSLDGNTPAQRAGASSPVPAALDRTGGGKAAITGDFVLIAREVDPVLKTSHDSGIEVTAPHSHMLTKMPKAVDSYRLLNRQAYFR